MTQIIEMSYADLQTGDQLFDLLDGFRPLPIGKVFEVTPSKIQGRVAITVTLAKTSGQLTHYAGDRVGVKRTRKTINKMPVHIHTDENWFHGSGDLASVAVCACGAEREMDVSWFQDGVNYSA